MALAAKLQYVINEVLSEVKYSAEKESELRDPLEKLLKYYLISLFIFFTKLIH